MIAARWFVGGGILALTLAPGASTQELAAPGSPQGIRADVAHVRPVALSMVVRESSGPLTKENIHQQISQVVGEYSRQGLDFSLAGHYPRPVVVLYEDPSGKRDVRMAVGLSAPPRQAAASKEVEAAVKAPLKYVPIDMKKAVRHIHMGPHEGLGDVYRAIEKELQASNPKQRASWPVVLQILDDPNRVEAKQLRVVMNVPVE